MRKLCSFSCFLLLALSLPALASAAPQAASPQSGTKSPSRMSAIPAKHPVKFARSPNAKSRPKLLAKNSPAQAAGDGLTPPDWYSDANEIPKQIAGATETPFPMVITNEGDTTITVTDISGSNPEFTFGGDCAAANGIPAGGTCTLQITYSPESACENSTVSITLTDNDPNGNLTLDLISFGASSGGITTDDLRDTSLSASAIAQSLVGPGVTISNVTYTGSPWAVGTFNGGNGIIGFNSGIILSNGAVSNVIGPNCSSGITQSNATPGDADLTNLIGGTITNDAAILEFDFVPTNPTISFQYVWASDEYQDFVFDYNDVFAFFLGQPGNATDIALIPGTNTIVSINNVNDGSTDPGNFNIPPVNPQFYVNNDFQFTEGNIAPYNTEMDGMTVVLTATANVTPGQTNHIKLAVADAIDTVYDSNVFIRAGSLVSSVVSPSPTGLAFGNVDVNTASPAQSVTITNVGSAPLTSLAITTSNQAFSQNNNCGNSLAAGASCTINVTFNSPTAGLVQGNIQIADNAPDSPQLISLSGTAISGPYVTFSPISLIFGPQAQGTSSQPQTITLTNSGTATLSVNEVQLLSASIDEDSEFTITSDQCSDSSVAPKATCTIAVAYSPDTQSEPPDVDAVVVTDNGQNQGQQTVALTGGVTVSVTVTPANLAFGNQKINTTSAVQTITVSNPLANTGSVTVASVIVTSGFAETNNCTTTQVLAPGTSCTINVSFSPTVAQAYSGVVTITDSAPGSPQIIPLTGTGTGATQTLTLAPASFNFGSQQVGTSSEPQTFTVTNPGPAAATVSGITASANFTVPLPNTENGCSIVGSTNLPASSSCTISVIFSPGGTGALTGTLTVPYALAGGAAGPTVTAALSGTGTAPAGTVTVAPSSLAFGSQVVSTTSAAQAITVTNTGTASVTISSVTAPGGFAQTNNCTTLAASATCAINVTFTPTAAQAYTGNVTITDTASGSPQLVAVSGTGVTSQVIISIPSGGSNTATSVPGGTAFFGLILTPAPGFTGTVQLSCTTSSPTVSCTPIPSTITLTGSGSTEVAFGIQTYCKGTTTNTGSLPALPTIPRGPGGIALLIVTLALSGASWTFRRNPRAAIAFALVLIVILGGAACSGGPAKGPNGITPAGTYYISLTATTSGGTTTLSNYLKLVVN